MASIVDVQQAIEAMKREMTDFVATENRKLFNELQTTLVAGDEKLEKQLVSMNKEYIG